MNDRKVLVVGLDCAPPEIVFDRRDEFPVLKGLMEGGIHGRLRSSDPPITIPAWMVMATGLDPGRLGLYGFRHRKGYSYDEMWIANSKAVREKKLWDYIGEAGGQSTLVSVPPSYPPYPVAGNLISCFITPPGPGKETTFPPGLKGELEERFGPYIFDVVFRTEDRDQILREIYAMTEKRFEVMDWLMTVKPWNLFMFVEIGVDRVHHAFWKYMDPAHHLYEPGNRFENAIIDYYKYLDGRIGRLIAKAGDDTVVLVVSDHGAKRMKGAFCVNEWLIEKGWLAVKEKPSKPTSLDDLPIDWSKRAAWASTASATERAIPTTRCGSPTPRLSARRNSGTTSARPAAKAPSSACRRATRPIPWPGTSSPVSSRRPGQGRKRLFRRVSRGSSRSASGLTSSTSSSGPRIATRSSGRSTP
ncbi:MAG: hypothetical protein A2V76_09810 [Candidatus Aminicenantes bacterium RBG_16_63_14]|nr:MAG: hypothetical protein A2V76_09810 [Candidatus Aminicenantes bacterium RBG_16_63_14]